MEMADKLGKKECDYVYLFEEDIKKGTLKKFTGVHPIVMKERIAALKAWGYEQLISKVKETVKIAFKDENVQN